MPFRPLSSSTSYTQLVGQITDQFREIFNKFQRLKNPLLMESQSTADVAYGSSAGTATTILAHGLDYTPRLIGTYNSVPLPYVDFKSADGTLSIRVTAVPDSANITFTVFIPTSSTLYATSFVATISYTLLKIGAS